VPTRSLANVRSDDYAETVGNAYVYRLGDTGIYKVGKSKDPSKRLAAYETISLEEVIEYACIPTNYQEKVETYIKDRLGSYRWRGAKGTELFKVDRHKLDEVIAEAREFDAHVLPKLASAARLAKQPCDGQVLTPDDAKWDMYWRALTLKQAEDTARYERISIEADLKLFMDRASALDGIATFRSEQRGELDRKGLKAKYPEVHAEFNQPAHRRPFKMRW
jgi:hypothetical protein